MVMTRDELWRVLAELQRTPRLMAMLLHGSGLRLFECAGLRIRDAGFAVAHQGLARHTSTVFVCATSRISSRGAGSVESPFAFGPESRGRQ